MVDVLRYHVDYLRLLTELSGEALSRIELKRQSNIDTIKEEIDARVPQEFSLNTNIGILLNDELIWLMELNLHQLGHVYQHHLVSVIELGQTCLLPVHITDKGLHILHVLPVLAHLEQWEALEYI